ncbi:polyketide synthase [Poronia punctata]|nr:polyketide synthase [Poronia punctata]
MEVEPLAIVGLSCRLPGGANDLESLWKLVGIGGEAWSPVPPDRFNEEAFHHPHANDPNGTNNHRGGHFIAGDVRDFDHAFFHLSPSVAAAMDPQQRILLELAYEALESAGWPREKVAGSRTAVYAAIFGFDYERILSKDVLDLPVYQSVGTGIAILANRISHAFDFRGPSVTVDTGCSGGLVALHQACQSLRSGESDAALVASANLQLIPDHYVGMSTQHMVSDSGRCHPFDVRGDGYGRGEGFVVVLVKRLKDALRDGDPIRSIILNTGVNQDGFTPSGITHPNRVAQAALIRETYSRVGLRPQDTVYVEAHGTGTVAGDTEELAAIAEVFSTPHRSLPLYVGSNKGSIGHTESTSGLASLLKAQCILEHGIIPPVAGFDNPKPGLPLDRFAIPTERVPWPREARSRISINSFGYGGTNAHAILERPQLMAKLSPHVSDKQCNRLFVFSANSRSSLKAMTESYRRWIEQNPETLLANLSYTLCRGRSALPWRFSCVADSLPSLVYELRQSLHRMPSKPVPAAKQIIFVFTGQGAQWAGMGRELLLNVKPTVFRHSILLSSDILRDIGASWRLEVELLRADSESSIDQAEFAQPMTTAIQIALVELLRTQGLRPSVVVGHSSGEIGAAYAAGLLSHRAALQVAFYRGFMATAVKARGLSQGAMASIGLGEEDVAPYLMNLARGKAVVACINSPNSVTVSGDAEAIDEVMARIDSAGSDVFKRKLRTDTAYHSHHMAAVAEDYRLRLADLDLRGADLASNSIDTSKTDIVFVSSVTGLPRSSVTSSYWVDNLVSRVNFLDAIRTIALSHTKRGGGHALFVEIGPHSALAGPVRQCLAASGLPSLEYDYLSVLQRGVDAITSTLALLGRLFERGFDITHNRILHLTPDFDSAALMTDLPSYPWDHTVKHWHESRLSSEYRLRREPYHDLLGVRMVESTAIEPRWRHMVGLNTLPWLADHVIDGLAVFPGAGYVCMVAEAVLQLAREQSLKPDCLAFSDISFLRGLVVPEAPQRLEMQLTLRRQPSGESLDYEFSVTAFSDNSWNEHCTGLVRGVLDSTSGHGDNVTPSDPHQNNILVNATELDTESLYREMASDGNTYGPTFQGLRDIKMQQDGHAAKAVIRVPDVAAVMPAQHQVPHVLHPATFDVMFHIGIPMIKKQHGAGSVMPVHISELLISTRLPVLSHPGSELDVSARITSNHYRATHINMMAMSGGHPLLLASGIESRSFAMRDQKPKGICYELEWKLDLDLVRVNDLRPTPTLADLIGCICFKKANLSVVELKGGHGEVAVKVLAAVSAHGGTLLTYDLTDTEADCFDQTRQRLSGYPVSYRVLDPEMDIEPQGFKPNSYDVVSTSDIPSLRGALALLKPDGVLLAVVSPSPVDWQATLLKTCPKVDVQLNFFDAVDGSLVILCRPARVWPRNRPPHFEIITHSHLKNPSPWVATLQTGLRQRGGFLSSRSMSHALNSVPDDTGSVMVIVDDLPQPILDDESCFGVVTALLRQKRCILWLSPDEPPTMHQVTGLARTAHAENDELRLTTVHVDSHALEDARLAHVIHCLLDQLTDQSRPVHYEREYVICKDAAVLIPRLHRSDRLNRAISSTERVDHVDIDTRSFVGDEWTLALSPSGKPGQDEAVFIEVNLSELDEDSVEIDTQAFVLANPSDDPVTLGEYAGIVRSVGALVNHLVPGDAVVALSLDGAIGHSRPRARQSHTVRYPESLSPDTVVALFLPSLAAVYALRELARLQKGAVILIHGALSEIGRATVAVARSAGISIVVTAATLEEAVEIGEVLVIPANNIFLVGPSLSKRHYDGALKWDAVIVASADALPVALLAFLRPFTHIVFLKSTSVDFTAKLPRNVTAHFVDISELLSARPELIPGLVSQAAQALQYIPVKGLNQAVQNISYIEEAYRQLNLGISEKVVINAVPGSLVHVAMASKTTDNRWGIEGAYVVAGGMGDLGRRFLFLLAQRGAKYLVTLSRRAVHPDDQRALGETLQRISPGCRLFCLQCDVTSELDVSRAARKLEDWGLSPVRGVIQSAVYLQDHTLETMTFEKFKPVTMPKIQGTLNLQRAFAGDCLDFFLMLSSAVVITGASGQANYNAGNAVQDAIAHRQRPGFMSLNIGWIEDAIHTANDRTKLQGLWRTGLTPIASEALSRYFDSLLGAASSRSQIRQAIIGFDQASLSHTSARNGNVQSALFCHVRGTQTTGNRLSSASIVRTFGEIVNSGDLEAVVSFITKAIISQLTTLISIDPSHVDAYHGSIINLGLDSLVAIELRNWITREFDASLQSSEIITDQPIRFLAQKVASRSRVVAARQVSNENTDSEGDNSSTNSTPPSTSPGLSDDEDFFKLSPLPMPTLVETLSLFEESRLAIDDAEERNTTSLAIRAFIGGVGPALHSQLQRMEPGDIADAYERQVYLQRREPLIETGQFTFIHPPGAPAHSQPLRAAIITAAAVDFERRLTRNEIAEDTLNGEPLSIEGRDWLFYATRRPGFGVDCMERRAPNHTVAVLRRGHIFQLSLPATGHLDLPVLHATFVKILKASHDVMPPICTLTADDRDSWAQNRQDLEGQMENEAALSCIDSAAFVVCLDDESPDGPGERYTQFLLNGAGRPLVNRWLDKTLQLIVTANGLSAETYEHTKLDGLDARALHTHLCLAILSHPVNQEMNSQVTYPLEEFSWASVPDIHERIEHISAHARSYGPLEYRTLDAAALGLSALRGTRSPPNATAHLTILLAMYLVDGEIRPAWEKVTLGTFARGRVEWVQTMSPEARAFVEAVAAQSHDEALLRALFNEATTAHARNIAAASRGYGAVGPLYALRGAAEKEGRPLPELFHTTAWDATRRGGPGQDIKIGFMRFTPEEENDNWPKTGIQGGEAGFLVPGNRGVYVHCNVQETHAQFAVSGKPAYVTDVCTALDRAIGIVDEILHRAVAMA